MAVVTKVFIISNAFVLLGKPPIKSIDAGNSIVQSASVLYDTLIPSLLASRPWRFALKQFTLPKLIDTPTINEWQYIYQLPTDLLSVYRVYPNMPYAIYQDRLYANASALQLEYMYDAPPSRFSDNFTMLATYCMAFHLAMPVTQQVSLASLWEDKYNKEFGVAAAIDALAMPNTFIQNDSLLSAHWGD